MQPNDEQQPQNQQPQPPVSPSPPAQPENLPQYQAPAPYEPSAQPQQPIAVQSQQPVENLEPPVVNTQQPQDSPTPLPQPEPVQWHAVEYVQHEKSPIWYVGFAAAVIILMVLAILLMKTWTFAVLIPVMAAALMVYSHRPPRELSYALSEKGLFINDQLHPIGEFKSFGVLQETDLHALMLIPIKRFRPSLTVYFPTEVGERIVDILGGYLPMQELHLDAFDKIIRKLRI